MVGGPGLRGADVRAVAREVHAACGSLWVDITVPSQFGCCACELGADVQGEALDRVAAGGLERKAVARARRDADLFAQVGGSPSHVLSPGDLEAIACGLDTFPFRMQRHCDHARALAVYLSCCERLAAVWYPGLATHPDHELATRVLLHGFGPAVDFRRVGSSARRSRSPCAMPT